MTDAPRPRLLLASGWAYPPRRLVPLATELGGIEVSLHGSREGLRGGLEAARTPCWLAGWSLGALQALEAAADHPERVRGVLLIGATARFCRTGDYPHGQPAAVVRAMVRALASRPASVLADFFRSSAAPEKPGQADLDEATAGALAGGTAPLRDGLEALLRTDLRARAASLALPALVLHGGRDEIIPASAARWLADALPRATLRLRTGAGHELPLREAAWTAGAIRDFVGA